MNKTDITTRSRRLLILQLLQDDADYTINQVLLSELLAELGYAVSSVVLQADLGVLNELSLLDLKQISGMTLVVLRARGVDVVKGLAVIPGVARPGPQ